MSARPISTRRAIPVGISVTSRSARCAMPSSSSTPSHSSRTSVLPLPQRLRMSPATWMLSRTVSEVNSSSRWNVRATPRRARLNGASAVMSSPSSNTTPDEGCSNPVTQLNNVVLPAPFGPIKPVIAPASAATSTDDNADAPPNFMPRPRHSRSDTADLRLRGHDAERRIEHRPIGATEGPLQPDQIEVLAVHGPIILDEAVLVDTLDDERDDDHRGDDDHREVPVADDATPREGPHRHDARDPGGSRGRGAAQRAETVHDLLGDAARVASQTDSDESRSDEAREVGEDGVEQPVELGIVAP